MSIVAAHTAPAFYGGCYARHRYNIRRFVVTLVAVSVQAAPLPPAKASADTANEDVWRGKMKYTEGEFRAISEDMLPGSRQCLLKRESGSVIIDFDLTPLQKFVAVLSGRANTVRYAERLRQQTRDWLDPFMETYETAARD